MDRFSISTVLDQKLNETLLLRNNYDFFAQKNGRKIRANALTHS